MSSCSRGSAGCKKTRTLRLFIQTVCLLFPLFFLLSESAGEAVRSQVLEIRPGWNAVYLEVDPHDRNPQRLLADLPIDVVAALVVPQRTAQFVRNPDADLLSLYGWLVWYAPHRSDAFLGALHEIQGGRPYLVYAHTNATWTVTGTIPPQRPTWLPDAYNFVGFSVQDPGGPSFAQFFSGSAAHNHNKIYRLVDGTWRQVLDPAGAVIRSGEAFWIYSKGPSTFSGPLEVRVPSVLGLTLSAQSGSEIVFRNRTAHPLSYTLEHIVEGNDAVPISAVIRAIDHQAAAFRSLPVNFPAAAWVQDFPELEPGAAIRLPLELRLRDAEAGRRHSLLRVRTDLGTETYIPVTATK